MDILRILFIGLLGIASAIAGQISPTVTTCPSKAGHNIARFSEVKASSELDSDHSAKNVIDWTTDEWAADVVKENEGATLTMSWPHEYCVVAVELIARKNNSAHIMKGRISLTGAGTTTDFNFFRIPPNKGSEDTPIRIAPKARVDFKTPAITKTLTFTVINVTRNRTVGSSGSDPLNVGLSEIMVYGYLLGDPKYPRERIPAPHAGMKLLTPPISESDCKKIAHVDSLGWTSGHKTKFCHNKGFEGHYNAGKCEYFEGGYCFNGIPEACAMKLENTRCTWRDSNPSSPTRPTFGVSFRFYCESVKDGSSSGDVGIVVSSHVSCADAVKEARRIFNEEHHSEPCVFGGVVTDRFRRWSGKVENMVLGECKSYQW